jgi:hypothetical protein
MEKRKIKSYLLPMFIGSHSFSTIPNLYLRPSKCLTKGVITSRNDFRPNTLFLTSMTRGTWKKKPSKRRSLRIMSTSVGSWMKNARSSTSSPTSLISKQEQKTFMERSYRWKVGINC